MARIHVNFREEHHGRVFYFAIQIIHLHVINNMGEFFDFDYHSSCTWEEFREIEVDALRIPQCVQLVYILITLVIRDSLSIFKGQFYSASRCSEDSIMALFGKIDP